MSVNETADKRGYRRGKIAKAFLRDGECWLGKSPATAKLFGQLVTINSEQCSQFGIRVGEVNSARSCR